MISMQKREPYEKNRVLNYKDLKKFFIPQLEINYCKESKAPVVTEDYNNYRVWLLFVKLEKDKWTCVQVAHSKNNIKEEINVAINDKKLEQRIMTVIPLFLIGYISMASPGFLDIMYKSIMGNIVMTVCLIVYLLAYLWSEKIVKVSI